MNESKVSFKSKIVWSSNTVDLVKTILLMPILNHGYSLSGFTRSLKSLIFHFVFLRPSSVLDLLKFILEVLKVLNFVQKNISFLMAKV